jgi:phosphatidylglycerophosphatase A
MMKLAIGISTFLGIGFIQKGAGTLTALLLCILWFYTAGDMSPYLSFALLIAESGLGVWASGKVEKAWGHDSNRVVIDEWAGMHLSLILVPISWKTVLAAFILFRFFDILKPLGIRKMEKLPGGWGVMGDDLLAGLYANLGLQLLMITEII